MNLFKLQLKVINNFINTKRPFHFYASFIERFRNWFASNQNISKEDGSISNDCKLLIKSLEENNFVSDDWIYVKNYTTLPKLSIPPLKQTISKYQEKMKVLLNEEEYFNFIRITNKFLDDKNLGPKCQRFLLERQKKLDNWAYDYWVGDMYLTSQIPLTIYSSPGYIMKCSTPVEDICRLGAQIVCSAVMIDSLIKHNIYPKENAFKKTPNVQLCMDQYHNIFRVCRIAGKDKDYIKKFNNQNNNHIIVIYQNDLYYVPIKISQDGVDEEAIYYCLKLIKNDKKKFKSLSVGILTTLERREWWKIKNILMKNSTNKQNLSLIEKAFFILCLDEPVNIDFNNVDKDENTLLLLKQSLHGGDSNQNSGNRWYDKTAQIILSESNCGFCFEHSPIDGIVSNTLIESLFHSIQKTSKLKFSKDIKKKVELVKLNWVLENDILKSINNASLKLDKLVNDLDMQVYVFKTYGSKFIKFYKSSPDAFMQLLFQLTYFKLYNKLCPTYESCSTRKFKRGRLDCIRPTTPEAFKWVKEMVKLKTDNCNKLKLWKNAYNAQLKECRDVAMGHGIDIHLLGLREAAKEILETVPELFTDKSYSMANNFMLSTSQIGSLKNGFCCFGPVVNNGYGVYYSIYPNYIVIIVSSFHSCKTTSTRQFLEKLKESFYEVKKMIEDVS